MGVTVREKIASTGQPRVDDLCPAACRLDRRPTAEVAVRRVDVEIA